MFPSVFILPPEALCSIFAVLKEKENAIEISVYTNYRSSCLLSSANLNILNKHKSQLGLDIEDGKNFPTDTILYYTFPKMSLLSSNVC